jgi:hypothetical protein
MMVNKRSFAGAAAAIVLVAAGTIVIARQHGDAPAITAGAGTDDGRTTNAAVAGDARARAAKSAQEAAHKGGDKPLWRTLTPAQQHALQPLQAEWDGLDGLRKQKWLQLANRFATLPPAEQQRVHERMRAWAALSPEQRELARETYNRTRKIAPDQKTATWESYQQLPDDEKKKLAAASATRKAPAAVPGQAGSKAAAPLGQGATACPAGTVKNAVSASPACVPATGAPGNPAPAAAPQPAAPAQPEKPVPANWGITPNDA